MESPNTYSAFEGFNLLVQGPLEDVVLKVKKRSEKSKTASILVFNDSSGLQMDFDLSGSDKDVLKRLKMFLPTEESKTEAPTGPGRPKLGVVAREISLLPRHWEWLASQSGGASATLRRLVEEARKTSNPRDIVRHAQDRTYKFMSTLAGNFPNYEEALRALYAKDEKKFKELIAGWPKDILIHTKELAKGVFQK